MLADRLEPSPRAGLVLAATAGLVAVGFRHRARVCVACALAGAFALGGYRLTSDLAAARAGAPRVSRDVAVAARVCAARDGSSWVVVELCELHAVDFGRETVAKDAVRLPGRVQLVEALATPEGQWLAALASGDRVRVRLRIGPLRSRVNPGTPDRTHALARRGIAARARLLDARLAVRLADGGSPGPFARLAAGRRAVAGRLRALGRGGALLAALALGDRAGLAATDREAFRRLGIAHLLAVSGLHVALVASFAWAAGFAGLRRLTPVSARWDGRLLALAAACATSLAYALASGWGVPVRRAWVFLLGSAFVMALRRGRVRWHALAASALAIATLEPAAVFEPGAQLSFVAAAALLASRRDEGSAAAFAGAARWRSRAVRAGRASLRVSATAIAATAPVLALHGRSGTPVGLLANAVAVPVTAFALLPAALLSASVAWLAGDAAGWLVSVPARLAQGWLTGVAWCATGLPASGVRLPPPSWAVGLAVALAMVVVRARRTRTRVAGVLVACGLLAWAPPPPLGAPPPRVVVLDVGQGDAILVQGRRAAILIDGGGVLSDGSDLGERVVVPALRALGVERLDVVIGTHADLDHRGGLPAVLRALEVGEVWLPRGSRREFAALVATARHVGVPVRERARGDPAAQRGDLRLETLWPPASRSGAFAARNDRSLVTRVGIGGVRVLLPGDIGRRVEHALTASHADLGASLLALPHHGSDGSSSGSFLKAVGAAVALVSAPCHGRSGLPAAAALERARAAGMSVWWTGRDGALEVAIREPAERHAVAAWGWRADAGCPGPDAHDREASARPARASRAR